MSSESESDLDPRIQIELENLNAATDDINKLEIELEEAKSTFRILMNESTRRLKLLTKKLGSCIEKSRPYYDALEKFREARAKCQTAAIKFQRANEIHAAAKETVALAEQRFMSNSHEWQFDNAWQEMLNHATQKVMNAELQKSECHTEHQKLAKLSHAAEIQTQTLEERFRRQIIKSRPYFEEKQICNEQLETQKNRITELEKQISIAKQTYSTALKNLEQISEEIHRQRGDLDGLQLRPPPPGPRIPGVGAELSLDFKEQLNNCHLEISPSDDNESLSGTLSSISTQNEEDSDVTKKIETLALRSFEGGDGSCQVESDVWEDNINSNDANRKSFYNMNPSSANETAENKKLSAYDFNGLNSCVNSLPVTPEKSFQIKSLKKLQPLPSENVSLGELPILSNLSNEILEQNKSRRGFLKQRRRSVE